MCKIKKYIYNFYLKFPSFLGSPIVGSPVSIGVLSGRASNAAKCSGTGLAHAHVGKEAAFTIHCVEDTAPTVQVSNTVKYLYLY